MTPPDTHAALRLDAVHKRLGGSPILQGVSLSVPAGQRLAIIGPNGAGKSTLFHLISGELAPDAGQIWLGAQRIDGWPAHRVARAGLARSYQIQQLFGRLSVADHLRCALLRDTPGSWWQRLDRQALQHRLEHWLDRLRLRARAEVPAALLSYAEQRWLDLGLAVVSGAPVLLLDEPTAGLSRGETADFIARLNELANGRTVLLVEHDMEVVFGLAQRVVVLANGQVLADGSPDAVRANPAVQAAYLGAALGECP